MPNSRWLHKQVIYSKYRILLLYNKKEQTYDKVNIDESESNYTE